MTDNEQIDYRHELYKRFELDEHEIREGGKSKSGKIQWFIYVNREPIQARLDELFFMAWNLEYFDRHIGADYVGVTCAIIINGVTRQYSGGQGLNGKKSVDEDTIKGAYTDAFKRAASMWGMGLYLQNAPQIWTEGYEDKNWAQKDQREQEAWDKFEAWYNGKPTPQSKPAQPRQTAPIPAQNGAETKITTLPVQTTTAGQLPPNNAAQPTPEQLEAERLSTERGYPVDYSKNPSPNNKSDVQAWNVWLTRQEKVWKGKAVTIS